MNTVPEDKPITISDVIFVSAKMLCYPVALGVVLAAVFNYLTYLNGFIGLGLTTLVYIIADVISLFFASDDDLLELHRMDGQLYRAPIVKYIIKRRGLQA